MVKQFPDRKRATIIPTNREAIPDTTLASILGPKQTNIGHDGLLALINAYGI